MTGSPPSGPCFGTFPLLCSSYSEGRKSSRRLTRPRRRALEPVASDGRRCSPSSLAAAPPSSVDGRPPLPATNSSTCRVQSGFNTDNYRRACTSLHKIYIAGSSAMSSIANPLSDYSPSIEDSREVGHRSFSYLGEGVQRCRGQRLHALRPHIVAHLAAGSGDEPRQRRDSHRCQALVRPPAAGNRDCSNRCESISLSTAVQAA